MPSSRATPTNREAPFALDELFFSTTDTGGRIRGGNDVFVRVSGYSRDEIIGSAHNIVRHPDMPRGTFHLLWERLKADRPIAAYVKNMTADGCFYWVMSAAEPTRDGFLSVRLKPSTETLDTVVALYAEVRAYEQELEEQGMPNREVAAAGAEKLLALLAEAGYESYDAFEQFILPAEIVSRESQLGRQRSTGSMGSHDRAIAALDRTTECLDDLFRQVGELQESSRVLGASAGTVRRLAEDVRLNAVNGLVAAARLSADGATLSIVADRMTHAAHDISQLVGRLDESLRPAISALGALALRISIAKAQVDMARAFAVDQAGQAADSSVAALGDLLYCVDQGAGDIARSSADVQHHIAGVSGVVDDVHATLEALGALHMCGRIEVAGVRDAAGFRVLLDDVKVQLDEGAKQVTSLRDAVDRCSRQDYNVAELVACVSGVRECIDGCESVEPVAA